MTTKLEEIGKAAKPGRYIVIEGEPYKVVGVQTSKPGKHGHAKFRIDAMHLFGGPKKSLLKSGHDQIEVPIVEKKGAQVLAFIGEKVQLMDMENYETFETEIPEELKGQLKEGQEVTYWEVLGKKTLMGAK